LYIAQLDAFVLLCKLLIWWNDLVEC